MMKYIHKDITTNKEGFILHGCNCSGGFGSGVAGAIRKKWPEVYTKFRKNGTGKKKLGTILPVQINNNLWVINLYTQEKYGNDGKRYASPDAIKNSLIEAMNYIKKLDIDHPTIISSKIGSQLGGLDWDNEVEPIYNEVIIEHLKEFEFEFEINYI